MKISLLNIHKALNKAYLRVNPNRTQIETFKNNIIDLFGKINDSESEEFHKNVISEFLKNTYYDPGYYINTKGRADLVVHSGKDASTPVGVLFEIKKPGNKSEMPATDNLKSKAFYEIILYYLRERIREKNISIKYLVITDIYEWFIFSSIDFERLFAGNKKLIAQFIDFDECRLAGSTTDFFYKNIAEPIINEIDSDISVTHFDIRDYESIIRNPDKGDDNKLVALFKIFSPEHLLRLPFANDSNSLDKVFYSELLHIIGLEETKEGSKKVIGRKKEDKRDPGSLIENAISILISEDCLSHLSKRSDYGNTRDEQLFNVALELSITWINRILFLKLLESQLVKYNKDDKTFIFLNNEKISDFDELNKLFFRILAVREQERSVEINKKYANIPYLNSSLFEPSDLEHRTIRINSLNDNTKLPLFSSTVLKDKTGKKLKGEIEPLEYLFSFLDAYDFSSEGSLDIQEENKTLINASVLGLIFEKINGYKDGSFFTPGFITMYMCHETITRAVVQKFNDVKDWQCESVNDVYNKIADIEEANLIINSLRICDPAVGSGHFLVSALNEIIAIKSELGILADKEGKRLKDYHVEVINDELIITDENGNLFEYNPRNKESQRVQETLFREKQMIIENCLFGVDINPNSVKICRLRLWIELLKNAYYKNSSELQPPLKLRLARQGSDFASHSWPKDSEGWAQNSEQSHELETLPNIDINIKCGNSLISRYSLDADIKSALKSSRWIVDNYREAVMTYRNAQSKDEKRSMEELIRKIRSEFETEVSKRDKRFLKLNKLKGDLIDLTGHGRLFDMTKTEKDEWNRKVNKIVNEIQVIESEIEEIKNNKIYENAFEWRFEFPEVLNNDGDFTGFDVVIGNPPYGISIKKSENLAYIFYNEILSGELETYNLFYYRGANLLNVNGLLCYITPDSWMTNSSSRLLRLWFSQKFDILQVYDFYKPFYDAKDTRCHSILIKRKNFKKCNNIHITQVLPRDPEYIYKDFRIEQKIVDDFGIQEWRLYVDDKERFLFNKMEKISVPLKQLYHIKYGLRTGDNSRYISLTSGLYPVIAGSDISTLYLINWTPKYLRVLDGLPEGYFKEFYSEEKIIIQYVRTNSLDLKAPWLESAFVRGNFIPLNSLSYIWQKTDQFHLFYVLALLNSKLLNKYYRSYYTDVNVKPTYLSQLPIPPFIDQEQINFINAVKRLYDNVLEADKVQYEIDQLVYKLYGLTEEEIRIVEG